GSPALTRSSSERRHGLGRRSARRRHRPVDGIHGWVDAQPGSGGGGSVLAAGGPIDADDAALIGVDLCRAVAAVHKAGLLHRDIKAQNVMRDGSGRIVRMVWGAGRTRAEAVPAGSITGT